MTLDWFTIVAQLINFLVLIYLLQRFLYGPIVKAMDERQEKIADRMRAAEEKRAEAEKDAESYRRQRTEFAETRAERIDEMEEEIDTRRQEQLERARTEIQELRDQWQADLERDQEQFVRDLREDVRLRIYEIARRALADVADTRLEAQAADAFLERLRTLENEEGQELRQMLGENGRPIVVRSAFDLSEEVREQIEDMLHEYAGNAPQVQFTTAPEAIAGIELETHNRVAAWHLDEYLDRLAEQTRQQLSTTKAQQPQVQTTTENGNGNQTLSNRHEHA